MEKKMVKMEKIIVKMDKVEKMEKILAILEKIVVMILCWTDRESTQQWQLISHAAALAA
jgi:hypothetical protein